MKLFRHRVKQLVLLSLLVLSNASYLNAAVLAPVNKVKVAFIIQFSQFVKWPSIPHQDQLNICAYGNDKATQELKLLSARQDLKVNYHIRLLSELDEISSCNILYIAESNQYQLSQILEAIKDQPILTVGSQSNFVKYGGVIGFINVAGNVRMEINHYQAKKNNLIINAKLLEVANLVIDKEKEGD